jgi:hypothetical protein
MTVNDSQRQSMAVWNDSAAFGQPRQLVELPAVRRRLGFGRIAGSEIETPILLANMV